MSAVCRNSKLSSKLIKHGSKLLCDTLETKIENPPLYILKHIVVIGYSHRISSIWPNKYFKSGVTLHIWDSACLSVCLYVSLSVCLYPFIFASKNLKSKIVCTHPPKQFFFLIYRHFDHFFLDSGAVPFRSPGDLRENFCQTFHSGTTRPDKHDCVVLVPCKKLRPCTLDKSSFTRYQKHMAMYNWSDCTAQA